MKRDRFRCTYCGTPGTDAELEIDHIIAVAKGGSHHISNLTTACRGCNQEKSDGDAPPRFDAPKTGLVGMFIHTRTADGAINWQGRIIGTHGDAALIQLYSWLSGDPTKVASLPIADVLKCDLYATNEAMVRAHFKDVDRKGELVGTVEECVDCWRLMHGAES